MSGMYLGEIARRVLLKISLHSSIFGNIDHAKLKTHFLLRYVVCLSSLELMLVINNVIHWSECMFPLALQQIWCSNWKHWQIEFNLDRYWLTLIDIGLCGLQDSTYFCNAPWWNTWSEDCGWNTGRKSRGMLTWWSLYHNFIPEENLEQYVSICR